MQGSLCLFRCFVDIQPMVERQTSGPLHRQKQQQTLINLQRERSRISRYNIKVGMWTFFPVFFLIPIHLVFINTTEAPEVEQYAIGGRMNVLKDLKESKGCK